MENFPFILPFNFLDIIIKGMIIGIVCSAPMGPVGVLCVQRTLNKGRWYGFVTGLGAALSDIIYALLTGFGMSFVMELIDNPQNKFFLQISGSILLFLFGLYCFRSDPRKKVHQGKGVKGSLTHNFVTAFIVTFSNPLIILLFLATFAQFAFVVPDHPIEQNIGYAGVLGGAIVWSLCLTTALNKLGSHFDMSTISLLNRLLGLLVMVASTVGLFYTLFR